ncbi:MAG: hypothetical protein CR217_01920 [Beijerinckiaceae bacterium]|nr:MAG: hypothetical protein CR217_01920 [Beijerinckiaceae bacterium]
MINRCPRFGNIRAQFFPIERDLPRAVLFLQRASSMRRFRQGQAILARLTKLSPDNAIWKQDLARFDRLIAELAKR